MFKSQSKTEQARAAFAEGPRRLQDHAATAADKATEFQGRAQDAADAARGVPRRPGSRPRTLPRRRATRRTTSREYAAPKVESAKDTFVDEVFPRWPRPSRRWPPAPSPPRVPPPRPRTMRRTPTRSSRRVRGQEEGSRRGFSSARSRGAAVAAYRKSTAKPDPWATATPYAPPSTAPARGQGGQPCRRRLARKHAAAANAAKDKVEDLKNAADDAADTALDKAADATDAVEDAVDETTDAAGDAWTNAKDWAEDKADEAKG